MTESSLKSSSEIDESAIAVQFLHSLAHAMATMTLYTPRHPACQGVVDTSYAQLKYLQSMTAAPSFSFLGDAVVYGQLPLHELRDWQWSTRLLELGIQRLEFSSRATREGLGAFLDDVRTRLLSGRSAAEARLDVEGVKWGSIGIRDRGTGEMLTIPRAKLSYRLGEEADVVRWLYERAASADEVPQDEVETVVASLTVAMHGDGQLLLPLLELKDHEAYRAMHAVNVSVLVMTLAEFLGLGSHDVRSFGTAGLLHDIGISRVPAELLSKPVLTAEDRQIIERHPEDGAKILLGKKGAFDLPAVVAYEHHMRPDGSGYPRVRYPRALHYASLVVSVCDVYDALRTARPYRPAWEAGRALQFIGEGAGTMFDAAIAHVFVAMLRRMQQELAASA